MLQGLVGVHDVEGGVGQWQLVDVTDEELHVGDAAPGHLVAGQCEHSLTRLQRDHDAVARHQLGQVTGDSARPRAHVEDP